MCVCLKDCRAHGRELDVLEVLTEDSRHLRVRVYDLQGLEIGQLGKTLRKFREHGVRRASRQNHIDNS